MTRVMLANRDLYSAGPMLSMFHVKQASRAQIPLLAVPGSA
ncbi:MAG: hypothetical protein Q7K25_08625 [Actinomycetota bacterium]|nr:hypothetical protein [Actinomycetota bacterium]